MVNITDQGHERGRREQPHAGDGLEQRHIGYRSTDRQELVLHRLHLRLESRYLVARIRQRGPHQFRNWRRTHQQLSNARDHVARAERNGGNPKFTQQASQAVQPSRACRQPGRAEPMERRNRLGVNRLHGDGVNVLVAVGLQERLRVGAIRLAASHIAVHIVRRQESNGVSELLQLSRPVMGRPARFQQHLRGRLFGRNTCGVESRRSAVACRTGGA